jgi:hypothetical protein
MCNLCYVQSLVVLVVLVLVLVVCVSVSFDCAQSLLGAIR